MDSIDILKYYSEGDFSLSVKEVTEQLYIQLILKDGIGGNSGQLKTPTQAK